LDAGKSILTSMSGISQGTLAYVLIALLFLGLVLGSGCLGMRGAGSSPPTDAAATGGPGGTTAAPVYSPAPQTTPPQEGTPSVDPIVGKWYAPIPDDLTFEFFPDGTFIERSPNFPPYQGTWSTSEEYFYDAFILDRWGYRKPAKFLYATGSLMTKGIGTMHRIE
jgi:hypothetical protein